MFSRKQQNPSRLWHGYPVRRLIAAAIGAVTVFTVVFGSATSLSISPDSIGASSAAVSACDTNGVGTSYTNAWDSTDNRYEVTAVTVTGIADACNGASVKVSLADSTGSRISGAEGSGTVSTASGTANARTVSVSLGTAASATSATTVHVVIG